MYNEGRRSITEEKGGREEKMAFENKRKNRERNFDKQEKRQKEKSDN